MRENYFLPSSGQEYFCVPDLVALVKANWQIALDNLFFPDESY